MEPLRVTPATADDYDACAALFAELKVPDAPWSREQFSMDVAHDSVVLRDGAHALGYAWGRPRGEVFHVVHVVVDPAHRKRGAGRTLMDALAARARALGLARWRLNVKEENTAARALYTRYGMSVDHEAASVHFAWSNVPRLEVAEGVRARAFEPADDATFEARCGLEPRELGSLREIRRVLIGAERHGVPVGVAALDVDFPGFSPFRVDASHARAVLETARAYARPEHAGIRIFAEGDPRLELALVGAGGEVVLRALRMSGAVPPSR